MYNDDGDPQSYDKNADELRRYNEAFGAFLLLLDLLRKLDIISGVEFSRFDSMTYVDRNWKPIDDDD